VVVLGERRIVRDRRGGELAITVIQPHEQALMPERILDNKVRASVVIDVQSRNREIGPVRCKGNSLNLVGAKVNLN
jgi:hypothetical protein